MIPRFTHLLLALALVTVVGMGLRSGAPFISGFILALALTQATSPLVGDLQRRGLRPGAALAIVLVLTLGIGIAVVLFVGRSLAQVAEQLPAYIDQIQTTLPTIPSDVTERPLITDLVRGVLGLIPDIVSAIGDFAGMLAVVFLIYAFMLWEGQQLPLRMASSGPMANRVLLRATDYNAQVRRYLIMTAWLGALSGGLIALFLLVVGVDFPILWGLLLCVMSFVPAVGLLIAAVPPIILAFAKFGLAGGLFVLAGFFVIVNFVQQIVKPKYMGQGLNLSRLVVLLSVVVWGNLIGPIGAFLALPLTVLVKMLLASFDETQWLAVVLSNRPVEPETLPDVAMLGAKEATSGS